MVKLNLSRFCALFLSCALVGNTAQAQQIIWGVGSNPAVGVADAEFANAFVQAGSYTPGDNPTAWTALSVSDNNGSPGAAYWTRSTIGYSQGAFWGGSTPISSPSQANGVAIFDSDFLDNGGVGSNQGGGTAPAPQRGELISPRIDLSGNTNNALGINCYALYRNAQITTLGIGISVDDGATWIEQDFRGTLPNLTQGNATAVFPDVTAGVTNLSQCRIKLIFDGRYYFGIVDDINIYIAPDYDATLGTGNNNNDLTIRNRGDYVKPGGARYLAYENIDPADLREWFFGGKVVNQGARDILPSFNPRFQIAIDYIDDITGAVTFDVYRDSIDYDTIPATDPVGATTLKYFNDIQFIMTHKAGDYRVKYWLSYDQADANPANDTTQFLFTVTDEDIPVPGGPRTKNYISLAGLANDGGVAANSGIFPNGGPYSQLEYGTVYYFPNGGTDSVNIDSISYRYRLATSFAGNATQTIFLHVYEMDPSAGFLDDGTRLRQIGLEPITLNGLGTAASPAGSFGLVSVTSITNAVTGNGPMPDLQDNGFYFISIVTNPGLTTGPSTFGATDVPWVGAVSSRNYNMNASETGVDSIIHPSPSGDIDAAGVVDWNWIGFGADDVPALGLYISTKNTMINTQIINTNEGAAFNVFPNPASDVLNIEFSLEQADDVMYITTDVTGRVIDIQNVNNVDNDVRTLDVSRFAAGTYFITARTSQGTSTQRFVVK